MKGERKGLRERRQGEGSACFIRVEGVLFRKSAAYAKGGLLTGRTAEASLGGDSRDRATNPSARLKGQILRLRQAPINSY